MRSPWERDVTEAVSMTTNSYCVSKFGKRTKRLVSTIAEIWIAFSRVVIKLQTRGPVVMMISVAMMVSVARMMLLRFALLISRSECFTLDALDREIKRLGGAAWQQ